MKIKNFKDLDVWKLSIDLVTEIYTLTSKFPESEKYGLTSQVRRFAVSVPSNIAEGSIRGSKPEYIRFANIATGSLAEVETQIVIARNLKYITEEEFKIFEGKFNSIGRMLFNLKTSLKKD